MDALKNEPAAGSCWTAHRSDQHSLEVPRGDVARPGKIGSSGGSGGLGFVPPPDLSVQEQLDRYPRSAIPDLRNFSVGIPPHLQNGDVFPSPTSVRHPVGDVAHDKSTEGAASWSRTAARWHAQPRLVQGRQRESLRMRLVSFFARHHAARRQ